MNGGWILKNMWAIEYRGESFFTSFFSLVKQSVSILVRVKGRPEIKKRKRGAFVFSEREREGTRVLEVGF